MGVASPGASSPRRAQPGPRRGLPLAPRARPLQVLRRHRYQLLMVDGQIIADGSNGRAYLLSPVPEPIANLLLLLGLGMLGLASGNGARGSSGR